MKLRPRSTKRRLNIGETTGSWQNVGEAKWCSSCGSRASVQHCRAACSHPLEQPRVPENAKATDARCGGAVQNTRCNRNLARMPRLLYLHSCRNSVSCLELLPARARACRLRRAWESTARWLFAVRLAFSAARIACVSCSGFFSSMASFSLLTVTSRRRALGEASCDSNSSIIASAPATSRESRSASAGGRHGSPLFGDPGTDRLNPSALLQCPSFLAASWASGEQPPHNVRVLCAERQCSGRNPADQTSGRPRMTPVSQHPVELFPPRVSRFNVRLTCTRNSRIQGSRPRIDSLILCGC